MQPSAPDHTPHPDTHLEPLKLTVYWLIVGAPLAWGIWQVAVKSLALFGLGG